MNTSKQIIKEQLSGKPREVRCYVCGKRGDAIANCPTPFKCKVG